MRAVTWQGREKVTVEEVPDPQLQEPTDAIIQVTSTAICGSDLHLYSMLGPFLKAGDILGHEAMGVVVEVGAEVQQIKPGDRVVIPFNISCGNCFMCDRELYAQCETTQVRDHGTGASLFGYTELYGSVPGGQAEYLRVPQAHFGPIPIPPELPDERVLYLSDILPTAWQGVDWADLPPNGTLAVLGLGPLGQLATRIALHQGHRVIGVDRVPERLTMAQEHGVETIDMDEVDDVGAALIETTNGRGPDGILEAVGMEAHGSPLESAMVSAVGHLPDRIAKPLIAKAAIDRTAALFTALTSVRRGGTVSISGVYGGQLDPLPMMVMFDRGITVRMGQCHVKRWIDEIWPVATADGDPLDLESLASHRLPLGRAPEAYAMFQAKKDGCIKVVLKPSVGVAEESAAGLNDTQDSSGQP
jgi:threonine dehydrogenase-like Zn-dependent dehydrogenase